MELSLRPDRPPTARQIYALAAALCAQEGYAWPANRREASELLGELRRELGLPRAELADNLLRPRRPRWKRYEEWELHREVADAFLRAERQAGGRLSTRSEGGRRPDSLPTQMG